jgi:Na+-transporting NADH:ubiquinone oxidoreductase subunit NqrB
MFFNDARLYQILVLSLFLLLGVATRDWTLQPEMVGVAIATCLLTQIGACLIQQARFPNDSTSHLFAATAKDAESQVRTQSITPGVASTLPSALITALSLSLLLRTGTYSTMMLAGGAAILSKFILRLRDKAIFNPANFGIVIVLLLSPDAWVSPGQWGANGWYALLFLGLGNLVLLKVQRWDTSVAFLATYASLEALRNYWLGWSWDVWSHRLMSGSLLLFALFMITDPRTSPNARISRWVWAIAIALLAFVLRNVFFTATAVFWALFALAPFTIALDWIFPTSQFTWKSAASLSPSSASLSES